MSRDKMELDFAVADATNDASVAETMQAPPSTGSAAIHCRVPGGKRVRRAFSMEWAAGFSDGEACICVVKQRYVDPKRNFTYRLSFSISQNDLQVLEHFSQGLGIAGGIFAVKRIAQHNRQVYTLNYSGKHALQVITELQPHLIRKRLEAQTAIDYWQQGQCGRRPGRCGWSAAVLAIRERFYNKLKSLK